MITKEDELKLYLVGIFDGEGCICPSLRKDGYIGLFVSVSMASESVIDLFIKIWGGSKGYRNPAKQNYLARSTWTVVGEKALPFLEYFVSRSIVKQIQAENAIILVKELIKYKHKRHGINNRLGEKCISLDEHLYRREIALKIKLNNGARSRYAQQ